MPDSAKYRVVERVHIENSCILNTPARQPLVVNPGTM